VGVNNCELLKMRGGFFVVVVNKAFISFLLHSLEKLFSYVGKFGPFYFTFNRLLNAGNPYECPLFVGKLKNDPRNGSIVQIFLINWSLCGFEMLRINQGVQRRLSLEEALTYVHY